jgi:hypothetical protein
MAATPMTVEKRPFSVEPFTKTMLPDGIFDTALKKQLITCFFTNTSGAALNDVTIYLEGVGDPGIVPVAQTHHFAQVPAGASVRVAWLADFELGTPGKKLVSLIAQAAGMTSSRIIKKIFVSQTRRDPVTGDYSCTVEEGTLVVSELTVHGPRGKWRPCGEQREREECPPVTGPWVPARMTAVWQPNPSYAGVHPDLPFGDPWWKILAWIVAAVAAIVAIVAAALGEGTAGTAVGGSFDETTGDVECCEPDPGGIPGDDGMTVAGVASAVATAAAVVGMTDEADPWWRGQEATPPAAGEVTLSEKLDIRFAYPDGAPQVGVDYPVHVAWRYARVTSGSTYTHEVDEVQRNIHVAGPVTVDVPAVHHAFAAPLVIRCKFEKDGGGHFTGDDLYAFCLLRSPDDMYVFLDLKDDGIEHDEAANDGIYTGSIHLEEVYRLLLKNKLRLEGTWRVYVFAQDINDATEDMKPEVAATHIGGFVVASGIHITFDPTLPCPLKAQASFEVVA